jgi:hypothetical protein
MRYAEALREVRERIRDGAADVVIDVMPQKKVRGAKAAHMRQAALDGLTEALIDEILSSALPGRESQLAEIIGLRIMCEVSRQTAQGSC